MGDFIIIFFYNKLVIIEVLLICIHIIYTDAEKKIGFQMSLCLVSDAPWINVPKYLELMYMVRNFNVKIDPSGLRPGVHTTT